MNKKYFIMIILFLPYALKSKDYLPKDNSRTGLNKYERIGHNEKVLIGLYTDFKKRKDQTGMQEKTIKTLLENEKKIKLENTQLTEKIEDLQVKLKRLEQKFSDFFEQIKAIHPSLR